MKVKVPWGTMAVVWVDRKSSVEREPKLSLTLIEAFTQRPESRLASQSLPMTLKKEVPWEMSMYTD